MTRDEVAAVIAPVATKYSLDPRLVFALILVESGGNQWAWNPEPRYRYCWDVKRHQPTRALTAEEVASKSPPVGFASIAGDPDQEWWGQQASWGLMQVMGAVAREHGCRVPYLTELCDPGLNITLGCQHLAPLMAWAGGDVTKALGGYNAGRGNYGSLAGQAYAAKVLRAQAQQESGA